LKVKGKSAAVSVYEIFDADPLDVREAKLATKQEFEKGLLLYNLGSFSEAVHLFQDCLRLNPKDTVAQIYLKRCQKFVF
jgi:tetratricopeptide (TPR) repeat protein